jgi:rhamnogalacturonan endolyase
MRHRTLSALVLLALGLLAIPAHGQRIMERLGRGLVAVGGGTGTLLSWRLYGTEQGTDVAFNVYKGATKLNAAPITNSTNYQDTAGGSGTYTLKAVVGGVEEVTGTTAMDLPKGYLEIPLKAAPGRTVKFGCVGDLDGDGEYEYVVDRQALNISQYIDAYKRDGTFLWRIDMGPNSTNTSNSNPGAANVGFGHSDNEAVFDIDSDGKGEFLVKAGNGTIFGDGKVLNATTNANDAFIVAVDGVTGAEKGTRIAVPNDNPTLGNMTGHFGIAYFDGVHPTLMFKAKWGGTKAMADFAFDFKDNAWSLRWKALDNPIGDYPNNHQIRCLDVNGDGLDEFVNGGYCRDGTGKLLWNMKSQGVVHGDRWHIGKFDPDRGMLGVAIEQNGPSFDAYEYDAATGKLLHTWGQNGGDLGRGDAGDIDPTKKGYEFWGGTSLGVVSTVDYTKIADGIPPANFRIWWDGDLLSENLNGNQISKWAYPGMPSGAFSGATLAGMVPGGSRPPLYGDMFGDWREEVMYEQSGSATMRIYTTAIPTDKRIYTLMHDPEYRNAMVEKGYTQSRFVDYYLGEGMADPPRPNIKYPDGTGASGAGGNTGSGGTSGSGGNTGSGGASGSGGATASGGTQSTGGAAVTGGRGGRDGGVPGNGGNPTTGGASAPDASGGTGIAGAGGTSASGGTQSAGGNPATGGHTAAASGGAVVAEGGVTSTLVTGTGGKSTTGAGVAGSSSGCSCELNGGTSATPKSAWSWLLLGVAALLSNARRRRRRRC